MKLEVIGKNFKPLLYCFIAFSISLFSNIITTIFVGTFYFNQTMTTHDTVFRSAITSNEPYVIPFFYLVPTIASIVYMGPLFLRGLKDREKTIPKKVLNTPLMISLIGSSGWILALLYQLISFTIIHRFTEYYYLAIVSSNMLLAAIFCFLLVYYLLDFVNRRFAIKQLFNNAKLSEIKGVINLTIVSKYTIFFIASFLFPFILLINTVFYYMRKHSDFSNLGNFIILVTILFIVIFGVASLFMLTYRTPVVEMTEATNKIQRGLFDIVLPVRSTDELGILVESINDTAVSLKEKELIKDTFGKMVDPNVRDYLLAGNLELGGELKESTILFSDIRRFTSLCEKMKAETVVALLNSYFDRMASCVEESGGLINRFIGDAILAVYGNPVPFDYHADAAVESAISMREQLSLLNRELVTRKMVKIEFGIGVHTGPVIAGNIGSQSRMEFTVIGDTVNLASRIESLTKAYKVPLLISEAVYKTLTDKKKYMMREIDYVRVKGKTRPTKIYEIYDADSKSLKDAKKYIQSIFTNGIVFYRNGDFKQAKVKFEECVKEAPLDSVSSIYLKRCEKLISNPPGKWEGIAVIR